MSTPTPEYSDFASSTMHEIHAAASLVAGAKSLVFEHSEGESNTELVQVRYLLRMAEDKLDSIVSSIDKSSFSYTLKPKQEGEA